MKYDYSNHRCPRCYDTITVKDTPERDITKIWCGGINCAFYFTPDGRVLTNREADELPQSHRLSDVFKHAGITNP